MQYSCASIPLSLSSFRSPSSANNVHLRFGSPSIAVLPPSSATPSPNFSIIAELAHASHSQTSNRLCFRLHCHLRAPALTTDRSLPESDEQFYDLLSPVLSFSQLCSTRNVTLTDLQHQLQLNISLSTTTTPPSNPKHSSELPRVTPHEIASHIDFLAAAHAHYDRLRHIVKLRFQQIALISVALMISNVASKFIPISQIIPSQFVYLIPLVFLLFIPTIPVHLSAAPSRFFLEIRPSNALLEADSTDSDAESVFSPESQREREDILLDNFIADLLTLTRIDFPPVDVLLSTLSCTAQVLSCGRCLRSILLLALVIPCLVSIFSHKLLLPALFSWLWFLLRTPTGQRCTVVLHRWLHI